MSSKLSLIALLLVMPSAFACFNDSGCPKNNVCIKTGNLLGICLSIYTPTQTFTTPGVASSPSGNSQVPVIPANNVPARAVGNTCTSNFNCQAGFVCSRPNYSLVGVCTQVNPQ